MSRKWFLERVSMCWRPSNNDMIELWMTRCCYPCCWALSWLPHRPMPSFASSKNQCPNMSWIGFSGLTTCCLNEEANAMASTLLLMTNERSDVLKGSLTLEKWSDEFVSAIQVCVVWVHVDFWFQQESRIRFYFGAQIFGGCIPIIIIIKFSSFIDGISVYLT